MIGQLRFTMKAPSIPLPSRKETQMTDSITALVIERGKTHGKFSDHAEATQILKRKYQLLLSKRHARGQPDLTDTQKESVEMILHKIGRILAGDANFPDHWDDIAGYAKIANGNF